MTTAIRTSIPQSTCYIGDNQPWIEKSSPDGVETRQERAVAERRVGKMDNKLN